MRERVFLNCPEEKLKKTRDIRQRKTKRLRTKQPDWHFYNSSYPPEKYFMLI